MSRMSTLLFRLSAAIMLGSVLLLAGCHRNQVKQEQNLAASMKGQFDLTLQAYKDGQFLLDGGVLSAVDVGSHFAYLRDQGHLPKKVLLIDSDDAKVGKKHLQYLDMDAAIRHCEKGIGLWDWASNDAGSVPDVVMVGCGDIATHRASASL